MHVKTTFLSLASSLFLISNFSGIVIAQTSMNANNSISIEKEAKKSMTQVNMIAKESSFIVSTTTVPTGKVEFIVSNQGELPHEMVVLKITESVDKLPLKGNRLDEAKSGTKIGEIESSELVSGATHKLMTDLTPGKYLLVSNTPGDYLAGMKILLTVK
jgi:uncharacterized cupredoxin-like copper-binding protein